MFASRAGDVHARVLVLTAVTDGATPVPAAFWWYTGQAWGSAGAGESAAAPAPPGAQSAAARTRIPAARAHGLAAMSPPLSSRAKRLHSRNRIDICGPGRGLSSRQGEGLANRGMRRAVAGEDPGQPAEVVAARVVRPRLRPPQN